MKGYKKNGKFVPTSSLIKSKKPSLKSHQAIVSRHAPDGSFTQTNPRTRQKESIKLRKIEALNKDKHVLIGNGSDGRPVSKIVS
jgi:hypothetical protein